MTTKGETSTAERRAHRLQGETRVAKLCDNPVKPISVLCTPVWQCHAASRPPDELRSNHVALVTESSCDGTHRTEKEFPHTK